MDAELDSLLSTASTVATKVEPRNTDPEPTSPSTSPSSSTQKDQQSKPSEKDTNSSSSSKKDHDRESRKRSSSRHRSKSRHHHSRHHSHRHHRRHHHRHSRSRSRSSSSRSRSPSPKRAHEQKRTPGNEGISGTLRGITTAAGEKREKERERPEDKSKRIVFAYNIPVNATMDELYKFFGRAGRVKDIRLISDRHTKRSKGMGYIEYESEVSVSKALALSGQTLLSLPVIITIPFSNNRSQQQQQGGASDPTGASGSSVDTSACVYAGNLAPNVTADDIRSIFGAFGEVIDVSMPVNILTKKPCGYAFVRYKDSGAANTVITHANLMEVAGCPMRLGYVLDSQMTKDIVPGNQNMNPMQQMQQPQSFPFKSANGMLGELDNDEGTGLTINSSSRIMLMKSLQGDDIPGQAPPTYNMMAALGNTGGQQQQQQQQQQPQVGAAGALGSAQIRSRCVILRDMFNPREEKDPNFDVEIKNDVFSEATRFGEITHIFVDKRSLGLVYIKFTSEESARAVVAQFNGRWFGGRQISAELSPEDYYNSKFSLN